MLDCQDFARKPSDADFQRRPNPPVEHASTQARRRVCPLLDAGLSPVGTQSRPRLRDPPRPRPQKTARHLRGTATRLSLGIGPAPSVHARGDARQRPCREAIGDRLLAVRRNARPARPGSAALARRPGLPRCDRRLPGLHRAGTNQASGRGDRCAGRGGRWQRHDSAVAAGNDRLGRRPPEAADSQALCRRLGTPGRRRAGLPQGGQNIGALSRLEPRMRHRGVCPRFADRSIRASGGKSRGRRRGRSGGVG